MLSTSAVRQRVGTLSSGVYNRVLVHVRERSRLRQALIVGPPFFILVVFFLFPLFMMVRFSFLTDFPPAEYTLENYVAIFAEPVYRGVLWNTLWVTAVTTAIVVAIGYTFAYSMVMFSRRTTTLLVLIVLPFWTNYIVRMYAWMNILQEDGLVNWIEANVFLLSDPTGHLFTWNAVIVGFIYIWLPLATLPFYASIQGMDHSLIESSKDLGAGPIRTFLNVTLPRTYDGLLAGTILVAIPTFGAFITPALLGGTDQTMIGMIVDIQFNQAFNWPFAAAISTVITLFVVLCVILAAFAGENVLQRGPER